MIDYEDFSKIDLRVAKVIGVKPHPNSKMLMVLTVDVGEAEPRTVYSRSSTSHTAEDLGGRTEVIVANFHPRSLRGVKFHGLLLGIGEGSDLKLATVEGDPAPGSRVL